MKAPGQRPRRIIARVCIAASSVILLALAVSAPLRHHADHGGWPAAAAAVVSIVAGLVYLRSSRGGAR